MLLFLFPLRGQHLDYAGRYSAAASSDSARLGIELDLREDSTFLLTVDYAFYRSMAGCGTGRQTYAGKWLRKKHLVFFKAGDPNFPLMDLGIAVNKSMLEKGYANVLKLTKDKAGRREIFFHYAYDCFETIWDYKPLKGQNN